MCVKQEVFVLKLGPRRPEAGSHISDLLSRSWGDLLSCCIVSELAAASAEVKTKPPARQYIPSTGPAQRVKASSGSAILQVREHSVSGFKSKPGTSCGAYICNRGVDGLGVPHGSRAPPSRPSDAILEEIGVGRRCVCRQPEQVLSSSQRFSGRS